jgi:ATP adenylyltransferase
MPGAQILGRLPSVIGSWGSSYGLATPEASRADVVPTLCYERPAMWTSPLFAPWRMDYILAPKKEGPCIFCHVREASADQRRERLVVCAAQRAFVMLNRYPYAAGHLIVMPYDHVADPSDLREDDHDALFRLVREAVVRLRAAVRCAGVNVGINLGTAAGASVHEHLHVQIVPRWEGDNNFMPVIADTRVIPQALDATLDTLRPHFADLDAA